MRINEEDVIVLYDKISDKTDVRWARNLTKKGVWSWLIHTDQRLQAHSLYISFTDV